MRGKEEIKILINFTEGWEERVAEASYKLYLRLEESNYLIGLNQKGE